MPTRIYWGVLFRTSLTGLICLNPSQLTGKQNFGRLTDAVRVNRLDWLTRLGGSPPTIPPPFTVTTQSSTSAKSTSTTKNPVTTTQAPYLPCKRTIIIGYDASSSLSSNLYQVGLNVVREIVVALETPKLPREPDVHRLQSLRASRFRLFLKQSPNTTAWLLPELGRN